MQVADTKNHYEPERTKTVKKEPKHKKRWTRIQSKATGAQKHSLIFHKSFFMARSRRIPNSIRDVRGKEIPFNQVYKKDGEPNYPAAIRRQEAIVDKTKNLNPSIDSKITEISKQCIPDNKPINGRPQENEYEKKIMASINKVQKEVDVTSHKPRMANEIKNTNSSPELKVNDKNIDKNEPDIEL